MPGYLAFHTNNSTYLLAYAVLMIPFATTGSIVGAGASWDKYAAMEGSCEALFDNDFGNGFCNKGWLNTLTVLGFVNWVVFYVTGFSALVQYAEGRHHNGGASKSLEHEGLPVVGAMA